MLMFFHNGNVQIFAILEQFDPNYQLLLRILEIVSYLGKQNFWTIVKYLLMSSNIRFAQRNDINDDYK